jgi:hypothetical protein
MSKFVVSALALVVSGQFAGAVKGWTLQSSFRAAGLPAVIYAFQNIMIQTAYDNMDGRWRCPRICHGDATLPSKH